MFPINKFDVEKCVTKYFDNNTRKALMTVARGSKPKINRTPAKAVMYCKKKADQEDANDDGNDDDDDDDDDNEEEEKEAMMRMIRDLVRHKKHHCASVAHTSGATFTEKYLISAIQRVLLKGASEGLLYAMWVYTQLSS
ncbi:unnamed protein product [Rhizopus stolonifer]